jgi:hypothetical protein
MRGPAGRRWLDRLIIGATAVAACVLVAPLLLEVIEESRQRRVDRNLQRLSTALQGYAESHGMYPTPPGSGPLSRAGLYAPTLVAEERIVANDGTLLVPDTALSRQESFRVPTLAELQAALTEAQKHAAAQEARIEELTQQRDALTAAIQQVGIIATLARIDEPQWKLGERLTEICKIYRAAIAPYVVK